ncbi:MAG: MFS transporter [Pseudomonadota bacterium]
MATRRFYGWNIVAMGTLGNALQGGLIFWSMGLYTSTFEDYFGASRARITLIETCVSVAVNIMFPFMGTWTDKRSARHFVAIGTFSAGLGLVLVGLAPKLEIIWLLFATLIPFGVLALGVLPSSALISRWFHERRGLGLGISVAGSSIGGFLLPPVMTYLFLTYGWRTGLIAAGVGLMLLAPVFLRVLVNYPADRGLQALGERAVKTPNSRIDWTIPRLLKNPVTYAQTLFSGSLLAITLGMLANLSLHAKDLGFTTEQTALLYSVIAVCSFGGKIAIGYVVDRAGVRPAALTTIGLMMASMLVFLTQKDYSGVMLAALLVGLGTGGVTPLWTSVIAGTFGASNFGRAIGVQNPMHIPLTAPSAPIAGRISDTTGSYDGVFLMYLGFAALSLIGFIVLQRLQSRSPAKPAT